MVDFLLIPILSEEAKEEEGEGVWRGEEELNASTVGWIEL